MLSLTGVGVRLPWIGAASAMALRCIAARATYRFGLGMRFRAGRGLYPFEQVAEERSRGRRIAVGLHQDVEDVPLLRFFWVVRWCANLSSSVEV